MNVMTSPGAHVCPVLAMDLTSLGVPVCLSARHGVSRGICVPSEVMDVTGGTCVLSAGHGTELRSVTDFDGATTSSILSSSRGWRTMNARRQIGCVARIATSALFESLLLLHYKHAFK